MPRSSPGPSSSSPPAIALDDHDESVRIAVSALGDMKSGTRSSPPAIAASPPTSPLAHHVSPDFVSRVTSIPLVGTALRAYEHGKASSRVVKYGAEMMESSVKNISRPVIDRLPVDVNQLDEFACRQLDRLERYRLVSSSDDKMSVDTPPSQRQDTREPSTASKTLRNHADAIADAIDDASPSPPPLPSLVADSRTLTPLSQDPTAHADHTSGRRALSRSRWQTVLLEAGGISAAVSEESMRRLKYCLQWLQYATTHIDSQILILRDVIDSLQSYVTDSSASDAYISPTHMRTLHNVRRDVVNTIRQVVDVVSEYAGGALPEPARARVRDFILHLPQRWASATSAGTAQYIPEGAPGASSVAGASAGGTGNNRRGLSSRQRKERSAGGPDRSLSGTPASSRAPSPLASSRASMARPTASAATRAAQHILTLATESLDMVRGVTGVVKESLDRADAWVERLRMVGVQRQHSASDEPLNPTTSSNEQYRQPPPGLSSTPSTPALADTPLSIPSTPVSPSEVPIGIRVSEMSARASLSELRLDGDGQGAGGYETPKCGLRPLHEGQGHVWEQRFAEREDERQDMIVDDDSR